MAELTPDAVDVAAALHLAAGSLAALQPNAVETASQLISDALTSCAAAASSSSSSAAAPSTAEAAIAGDLQAKKLRLLRSVSGWGRVLAAADDPAAAAAAAGLLVLGGRVPPSVAALARARLFAQIVRAVEAEAAQRTIPVLAKAVRHLVRSAAATAAAGGGGGCGGGGDNAPQQSGFDNVAAAQQASNLLHHDAAAAAAQQEGDNDCKAVYAAVMCIGKWAELRRIQQQRWCGDAFSTEKAAETVELVREGLKFALQDLGGF